MQRSIAVCVGAGLLAGLAAALYLVPAAPGKPNLPAKPTTVVVTAGKPTELGFKLSKFSNLRPGTFVFKVTNRGVVTHDFKICTKPATNSKANACVGKVTKMLKTGKTATLTVKLTKKGKYEFLCTVPGHAGAGMKGLLGVGVKVTAAAEAAKASTSPSGSTGTQGEAAPPPTTTTPATSGSGSASSTCASPVTTNVDVNMFDFGFTVTPSTAPCGTLNITERNTGNVEHNFDIKGQAGAIIQPGETSTFKANLTPGQAGYICDVPGHDGLGMVGTMTITG